MTNKTNILICLPHILLELPVAIARKLRTTKTVLEKWKKSEWTLGVHIVTLVSVVTPY